MNRSLVHFLLAVLFLALGASGADALQLPDLGEIGDAVARMGGSAADAASQVANDAAEETEGRLSQALEIVLLLTALSLLPAALISVTCFTRIVIVLSFVRRSLSVNELPPNPVILGLALFLTSFVMAPVFTRMYERAYVPYEAGEIQFEQAAGEAWEELGGFLVANTRETEIELFRELSGNDSPEGEALPFTVIVPAFVLSELKTAFQMGFLLFLPFLVIDLVVSSVLLSMGMFMLPPVTISTPFKILLFVLVDGWSLVCQSLVSSFVTV